MPPSELSSSSSPSSVVELSVQATLITLSLTADVAPIVGATKASAGMVMLTILETAEVPLAFDAATSNWMTVPTASAVTPLKVAPVLPVADGLEDVTELKGLKLPVVPTL